MAEISTSAVFNEPTNNRLAVLAAEIRAAHEDVRHYTEYSAQRAYDAGARLMEARDSSDIPFGGYERWVKEVVGIPPDTAGHYIRIFRAVKERGLTVSDVAEASQKGVLRMLRETEALERREASLRAEPLPEGMEYRIGDCRVVMEDIEDGTVAALITDPPYDRDALPLVEFAAEYAQRKLVDGGSAIFYLGTALLPDYHAILSKYLTYCWEAVLLNDQAQTMDGVGVRASHKTILWYVKGTRRRAVHGDHITIVPDVLNDYRPDEMQQDLELEERERAQSTRDKSEHRWAQGDAGVRVWIHHLTRQGEKIGDLWLREPELIVDLFAGTGNWGRIAAEMGRRWKGCDIVMGGTTTIAAEPLPNNASPAPSARLTSMAAELRAPGWTVLPPDEPQQGGDT
jgi:hypothetical protein